MKKFVPILTVFATSALLVGVDIKLSKNGENKPNLNKILSSYTRLTDINTNNIENNKTFLNKYKLSLTTANDVEILENNKSVSLDKIKIEDNEIKTEIFENPITDDQINNFEFPNIDLNLDNLENEEISSVNEKEENDLNNANIENQNDIEIIENNTILEENNINYEIDDNIENVEEKSISIDNEESLTTKEEKFSTLYSLADDISNVCDEYCELKNKLTSAISETNLLINKIKNNELNLTSNQKLAISSQAIQLNNLAKKLSLATNELEFNLSEIAELINSNSQDYDNLTVKYLIFLNNMINQNNMLNDSLQSVSQINDIFANNSRKIPNDAYGRIFYGYQKNNEKPQIKDYYFDSNNNLIENDDQSDNSSDINKENESQNIDENSANDGNLNQNVNNESQFFRRNTDTYMNSNMDRNIDTFFNTALFDNDFMYGANNYGGPYRYNGNYMNPYMFQNYQNNYPYPNNDYYNMQHANNQNNNDSISSMNNSENTQHIVDNNKKEKFKLKKNIDTYRDDNTPDLKSKFSNFKNSITNMFNKKRNK